VRHNVNKFFGIAAAKFLPSTAVINNGIDGRHFADAKLGRKAAHGSNPVPGLLARPW